MARIHFGHKEEAEGRRDTERTIHQKSGGAFGIYIRCVCPGAAGRRQNAYATFKPRFRFDFSGGRATY
jgi:hypothetical protein